MLCAGRKVVFQCCSVSKGADVSVLWFWVLRLLPANYSDRTTIGPQLSGHPEWR